MEKGYGWENLGVHHTHKAEDHHPMRPTIRVHNLKFTTTTVFVNYDYNNPSSYPALAPN